MFWCVRMCVMAYVIKTHTQYVWWICLCVLHNEKHSSSIVPYHPLLKSMRSVKHCHFNMQLQDALWFQHARAMVDSRWLTPRARAMVDNRCPVRLQTQVTKEDAGTDSMGDDFIMEVKIWFAFLLACTCQCWACPVRAVGDCRRETYLWDQATLLSVYDKRNICLDWSIVFLRVSQHRRQCVADNGFVLMSWSVPIHTVDLWSDQFAFVCCAMKSAWIVFVGQQQFC